MAKLTPNEARLKAHDKLVANRIPKHPLFDTILCVTGIVDSYGAVHGVIVFMGDDEGPHHATHFPNPRYKAWRWWRCSGMEKSCLCTVQPDDEDWEAVRNWLYKRGCLQDWEI